jgi:hypothetical protein
MTTLKHLVLQPRAGLCNRLRAIASAKRLGALFGITCTICWDWGDFYEFFVPDPLMDWIPALTPEMKASWPRVSHRHSCQGGEPANQRIDLERHTHIVLGSCYAFNALQEAGLIEEEQLGQWIPRPAKAIVQEVQEFKTTRFSNTVGVHLRRTDHKRANDWSPDGLFFTEIEALIAAGRTIFLSTDRREYEALIRERFGTRIIVYPKSQNLPKRWPRRRFNREETFDDLVDLHLLATCEFVIGSAYSSFSRIAITLNGSVHCKALTCH